MRYVLFLSILSIMFLSCSEGSKKNDEDINAYIDTDDHDIVVDQDDSDDDQETVSDQLEEDEDADSNDDMPDIDEVVDLCAGIDCSGKGDCQVEKGSPVCVCAEGYEKDTEGTDCVDADECKNGENNCGQLQCHNLEGSFECVQCMSLMTCKKVAGAVNGAITDIMNVDGYLYVFSSYHIDVFEITETNELIQVSGDIVDGNPVYIKDGLLFVSNEKKQELLIYLTEDNLHFNKVGSLGMAIVQSVYLYNAMLYIIGFENEADANSYYSVFDVGDPANPIKEGVYEFENTNPNNSFVRDGYAYISTDKRLIILDVSDSMSPVDVTNASLEETGSWDMDMNGNYLYLAGNYQDGMDYYEDFLKTIDITDPMNPVELAYLKLSDSNGSIEVSEKYAVISDGSIYDISDPETYVKKGQLSGENFIKGVHIKGDTVYFATPGNLNSVSINEGVVGDTVHLFNSISNVKGFHFNGKTLYLTEEFKTLSIYDVTDPYAPQFINAVEYNGRESMTLAFNNNTVYVGFKAGYNGEPAFIESFDVSDPSNVVSIEKIEMPWTPLDFTVAGSLLFVAYRDKNNYKDFGLKIYDISDHSDMELKSALNFYEVGKPSEDYANILVDGNYAFVAGFKFYVVNIEDTDAPVLIARANLFAGSSDLFLEGDTIYSVLSDYGLEILDVSEKESPSHLLSGVEMPHVYLTGVWKKDDIVLASGNKGVHVFDVTDTQTQVYLGFFDAQNVGFEHIYLDDEYIYLLGDGLRIIKQENIATCAINND